MVLEFLKDFKQQIYFMYVEFIDLVFNSLKMRVIIGISEFFNKYIFIDFCVVIVLCEIVFV